MAIHGVSITEEALGPQSSQLADNMAGGIIGTAPGAAENGTFGLGAGKGIAYHTPFLLTKRSDAGQHLGTSGTLPDALDSIYAQGRSKTVMIIVPEGFNAEAFSVATMTYKNAAGSLTAAQFTFDSKAEEPIQTMVFSSSLSQDNQRELSKIKAGQTITFTKTGGSGAAHDPINVVAVSDWDDTRKAVNIQGRPAITPDDIYTISGVASSQKENRRTNALGSLSHDPYTGVYAFLNAENVTGVKPRFICAAGIDTGSRPGGSANPLAAALQTVAERLQGIAIVDGPNTTHAAAIEWAGDFASDRVYTIDPHAKYAKSDGSIVDLPFSGFAMGLFIENARRRGFWTSPSNQIFNNVLGTSRPVDFEMGNPASRAQLLNDAGVATVVNIFGGGYRLWGAESQAAADREPWKFVNVRIIADVLYETLLRNHLWAIDKNITTQYVNSVVEGVNAVIKQLMGFGALLGGECYANAEKTTQQAIQAGEVFFNVDYTPTYPATSINFSVNLTNKYLSNLQLSN